MLPSSLQQRLIKSWYAYRSTVNNDVSGHARRVYLSARNLAIDYIHERLEKER